jgi:hypothetical protein
MKKVIALLATAAVASVGFVASAATASEGWGGRASPNCVTRVELGMVQANGRGELGTRKFRVHRVFDTRGEFYGRQDGHLGRIYERCGRHRRDDVIVDYTRQAGEWRVNFKAFQDLGWDDRDCVTRYEYRDIEDGMSRSHVQNWILDGQRPLDRINSTSNPPKMQLHYEACGAAGNVVVHFEKPNRIWRVVAKDRLGRLDTPGCVTRAERLMIKTDTTGVHGTRMVRVHRIFDTRGERIGEGDGYVTRAYDRCGRHRLDHAIVDYSRTSGVWRATFASFANLP